MIALGSLETSSEVLTAKEIETILRDSWRLDVNGWMFVHTNGGPYQRGFQNGYLLGNEILRVMQTLRLYVEGVYKRNWQFFRETGMKLYWPKLTEEYQNEIEGIRGGIQAVNVTGIDTADIVALNGFFDTVSYHYSLKNEEGQHQPLGIGQEHCSALIASGKATTDGKIVLAHNTWFSYMTGSGYNLILSVIPEEGNEFLMQTYPGTISSGTDWFISKSGLVIAETTISGMTSFNPHGVPYFMRSRKAIQYATTLDGWIRMMIEENNGGYACDWLIGDVKTGEIGCLELGTTNHNLERTRSGVIGSSNIASSDRVRAETNFDYADGSLSCTARRERWKQLIDSNNGLVNVENAKIFLADHYDAFSHTEGPNRNSLCGHVELDRRGMPEADLGPNNPTGAFDGKVTDSNLASAGAFWAHWGKPCNTPFLAKAFLSEHPEYRWQGPHLRDIEPYPWTLFTVPKWAAGS